MGHIDHPRNQITFAQGYVYIITLILRGKKMIICFLITEWSLLVKPQVQFTKGCFELSFVEIGPVVLEKNFFNFVNVFSIFRKYLPV